MVSLWLISIDESSKQRSQISTSGYAVVLELLPDHAVPPEAAAPALRGQTPTGKEPISPLQPAAALGGRRAAPVDRSSALRSPSQPDIPKPSRHRDLPPERDFGWRAEDGEALGMARSRGEPLVRLAPKQPSDLSPLGQGIAKSARPPCKDAHAAKGLLALPFLLTDTIVDRGCKW
jgi:hypothetical protein